MPAQTTSTRDELRAATREVHESLHHHQGMSFSVDGRIDPSRYAETLHVLRTVFGEVEVCRRRLGIDDTFGLAPELEALDRDLLEASRPLSEVHGPLALDQAEVALGGLYTVMGSSFGRRGVLPRLQQAMPERGHHLHALPHDGARWKALMEQMEARGVDPDGRARLVDGATRTFLRIREVADARA